MYVCALFLTAAVAGPNQICKVAGPRKMAELLRNSTMYKNTTVPLHASPGEVAGHGLRKQNLTLDDIKSDSISTIAEKHWSGKKIQWNAEIVETIVENELKPNQYDPRKLMLLEYTQYLEKVNKKRNDVFYFYCGSN